MKTSFWTSTCSPFLFTLVPFLAACSGGGTGDDKACWEEDPPTPEGIPSAARHRARINVAEETKYNGDTEKTTRSVIAAFSDISLAEML